MEVRNDPTLGFDLAAHHAWIRELPFRRLWLVWRPQSPLAPAWRNAPWALTGLINNWLRGALWRSPSACEALRCSARSPCVPDVSTPGQPFRCLQPNSCLADWLWPVDEASGNHHTPMAGLSVVPSTPGESGVTLRLTLLGTPAVSQGADVMRALLTHLLEREGLAVGGTNLIGHTARQPGLDWTSTESVSSPWEQHSWRVDRGPSITGPVSVEGEDAGTWGDLANTLAQSTRWRLHLLSPMRANQTLLQRLHQGQLVDHLSAPDGPMASRLYKFTLMRGKEAGVIERDHPDMPALRDAALRHRAVATTGNLGGLASLRFADSAHSSLRLWALRDPPFDGLVGYADCELVPSANSNHLSAMTVWLAGVDLTGWGRTPSKGYGAVQVVPLAERQVQEESQWP